MTHEQLEAAEVQLNGGLKKVGQWAGIMGVLVAVFSAGALAMAMKMHMNDVERHQTVDEKHALIDERVNLVIGPKLDLILLRVNNLREDVQDIRDEVENGR